VIDLLLSDNLSSIVPPSAILLIVVLQIIIPKCCSTECHSIECFDTDISLYQQLANQFLLRIIKFFSN